MPQFSYIYWDKNIGGPKPDPRLPDILCAGSDEEVNRALPIAKLVTGGAQYSPGYCVGVYMPLPKRRSRSPESIAVSRRKAIEKRAAEKGGLFADYLLEKLLKDNADRLNPEKIREEQKRLEQALSETEKIKDQGAYMTPQEAVRFLIRLPVPFISDWIDVWQEFRLTRVWTPRMRGYIPNLNDPIERERQNRIHQGISAFGKEKSEGELLKMLKF